MFNLIYNIETGTLISQTDLPVDLVELRGRGYAVLDVSDAPDIDEERWNADKRTMESYSIAQSADQIDLARLQSDGVQSDDDLKRGVELLLKVISVETFE